MDTEADKLIADLRKQFEAVPALPEGRSETLAQKVAELQKEIERLSQERDKFAEKPIISDSDRALYEFRQDVIRRKLEKLAKLADGEG